MTTLTGDEIKRIEQETARTNEEYSIFVFGKKRNTIKLGFVFC